LLDVEATFNCENHTNMKATSAVPIFQVSNVEASLKHYTSVLGFVEDFRFDDYAGVKLGDVRLYLSGHSIHERPIGGGTAYILCDEVDDYCARIKKNGAIVKSDPKDYPYGMRDFVTVDLDGNHLAFGCEVKNI
jgi:uncharacterized glyoxalase superfamily protein PhnB